ncbi:MAG: fructose-6-phosphate aldolase [Bombilactobacillus mellifer]|nr:fructose-6-phosphate aldolase [Bombilactobacillus mellifer]
MEFLLDTVHLSDIEKYDSVINLSGVTSNPSIIKKEGKIDFFNHLQKIRKILGKHRPLHVQVVGQTTEAMIADAHSVLEKIDPNVYIKIPTNQAGLTAMKILKKEDVKITATAIYSEFQGRLAMEIGADYLAPYYNRMVNLGLNAQKILNNLANQIARDNSQTKILAASFHTVEQVNEAFQAGCQAATLGADIFQTALNNPAIKGAIKDFTEDWESIYGTNTTITSLK